MRNPPPSASAEIRTPTGADPARFAYNTGSNRLYVTNFGSDAISVIE